MLKAFYILLISLIITSCGFSYLSHDFHDLESKEFVNLRESNFLCISKNYLFCSEVLHLIKTGLNQQFDGVIEVSLNDSNESFSNWDSSGLPRMTNINLEAKYIILPSRGIITEGFKKDNFLYQFNSSLVSGLANYDYSVKMLSQSTASEVINLIHRINFQDKKSQYE
jgi:hypothetical protein